MHTLRYRLLIITALTALSAIIIAACSGQPGSPVDPTATVAPTEEPGAEPKPIQGTPGAVITGTAGIETIDLLTLESFPVQIRANVKGYLGDGCTTLDTITQTRAGDTFYVTITTTRPADAICTMQLVGFEESIPLDVVGLPAGTYTVEINGVTTTFTLDMDNTLE